MSHNKKPVIIVALVLFALMVVPVIVLLLSRGSDSAPIAADGVAVHATGSATDPADFDLRQLAEKAENLLADDLAAALRKGDVSLNFIAELDEDAGKARDALSAGKLDKAQKYYTAVVTAAENQLNALTIAEAARALNETTYAQLKELEYLQASFANTYREAVETYNAGLRELTAREYSTSIGRFEMAGGILAELEGRAIQQVGGLLEAAAIALDALDFAAARTAYQEVLQIDSDDRAATDGLAMVTALDGIGAEVRALHALEAAGELDQAMAALEALLVEHPKNLYLLNERRSIETQQQARALQAALARADQFEAAGDWLAAISSLQEAILLRPSPKLNERLAALQKKAKAARLETLLDEGYNALKAGSYDSARKSYREAVDLAPQSKEARTGLEKASSLYLANIRYTQNISSAAKYLIEGRYPLVAKFFNDAMASRPSTLPPSKVEEESRIRSELALQSKEVSLQITSNKKTYVSLIGVFAPERFKSKDLNLFPDVYKVRGTRKGYRTVEFDLKLNSASAKVLEVICTEKL